MTIYFSAKCLEYGQPGHPESQDRVAKTTEFLKKNGYAFHEPKPCTQEDVLRVHSENLYTSVNDGSFLDADTPSMPNMIDYAMLSAGAATQSCDSAAGGVNAFSLMRPPGHHATRTKSMGFCYFNNIAIAAARHLNQRPKAKIAILDIDCHHGNGTEDIFFGSPNVLYVSLHQSPLYPGTGLESKQNCLNYPLSPGTDENTYLKTLKTAFNQIVRFKPSLLGVSAGFDTFKDDPLTGFNLDISTYRKIGETIAGLKKPVFAVLEGGYSPRLPECVLDFIEGLTVQ